MQIAVCIWMIGVLLAPLAVAQATRPSGEASVKGVVRDSEHHPVAGAEVLLQPATGVPTQNMRTDSAGAFKFSGLPPGTYTIHAEMSGKGKARSGPVNLATNDTKTADLTLSAPDLAFFDEPTFSVAGVTDTTNLGGHGSDTVVRTKDALAKATVSLTKAAARNQATNPDVTEQSLRASLENDPGNFVANVRLAKLLVEQGRTGDAKPYLARASEVESGSNSISAGDRAGLDHLLGDVAEKTGDPLAAVREYQRASELDPSETNIFDWGAELLIHHAPEPAAEVFTNGNRRFPRSARMLVGLGVAWFVRGSYEQAATRLSEASDLEPDDPTPYLFLGKIQSVEGSLSKGITERFLRFVTLQPQNSLANYYYAVSLWNERKGPEDRETTAKVETLLEKAVALDPKLGEAFLELGIVADERKDVRNAIAAYESAIRANPRMEQAHYRLAQAYRISGQNHNAQEELRLYQEVAKERTAEVERERSEVKQFVYTLRGQKPSRPQP